MRKKSDLRHRADVHGCNLPVTRVVSVTNARFTIGRIDNSHDKLPSFAETTSDALAG